MINSMSKLMNSNSIYKSFSRPEKKKQPLDSNNGGWSKIIMLINIANMQPMQHLDDRSWTE